MRNKWISVHDKVTGTTSFVLASEYRPPESEKRKAPDWASETPIRGCWAFRETAEGRKLVDLSSFQSDSSSNYFVVGDNMEPTENPIDGQIYDSKSKYYAVVKGADAFIADGNTKERIFERKRQLEREAEVDRKNNIIDIVKKWNSNKDWRMQEMNRLKKEA
jgi:hypothetical protein